MPTINNYLSTKVAKDNLMILKTNHHDGSKSVFKCEIHSVSAVKGVITVISNDVQIKFDKNGKELNPNRLTSKRVLNLIDDEDLKLFNGLVVLQRQKSLKSQILEKINNITDTLELESILNSLVKE